MYVSGVRRLVTARRFIGRLDMSYLGIDHMDHGRPPYGMPGECLGETLQGCIRSAPVGGSGT